MWLMLVTRDFPWLLRAWRQASFQGKRREIEPEELPYCSIPCPLIAYIQQISIGNSMSCSDIWHKYHEWYFKIIVMRDFMSR